MARVVKRVQRNAVFAWSPNPVQDELLATATAAGGIGDSFDATSALEIFSVDVSDASQKMRVVARLPMEERVECLVWTKGGRGGYLAAGTGDGTVMLWDAEKMLAGDTNSLLSTSTRHVNGRSIVLDANPVLGNLLASGTSTGELLVWDIANPVEPNAYAPSAAQYALSEPVTCIQWNRKVPHIMATAAGAGNVVVWDLKNKKPIISFSDKSGRLRSCRSLQWHPQQATQLVTANEDDTSPALQLWDLRNTRCPVKYFEGHTQGVWACSWSGFDSRFLLSSGKDSRSFCWDVDSGKIVSETVGTNWNTDIQWSPRIPALFAYASLDGEIAVASSHDVRSKASGPCEPPSWLKRSSGASLAFGNRVLSFSAFEEATARSVHIKSTGGGGSLKEKSSRLSEVLSGDAESVQAYCQQRAAECPESEGDAWRYLATRFATEKENEVIRLLGYDSETLEQAASRHLSEVSGAEPDVETEAVVAEEPSAAVEEEKPRDPDDVSNLFGGGGDVDPFAGVGGEVDDDPFAGIGGADAFGAGTDVSFGADGGDEPPAAGGQSQSRSILNVAARYPTKIRLPEPSDQSDAYEGQLARHLIARDFRGAVECCLAAGKLLDALLLASSAGPEVLEETRAKCFEKQLHRPVMGLASLLAGNDLRSVIARSDLEQWKLVLAIVFRYASPDEVGALCTDLGELLRESGNEDAAVLCFIVGSDLERTLEVWASRAGHTPEALHSLVERVSVMRKALGCGESGISGALLDRFAAYATLLADEGCYQEALNYISFAAGPEYQGTDIQFAFHRISSALQVEATEAQFNTFEEAPPAAFVADAATPPAAAEAPFASEPSPYQAEPNPFAPTQQQDASAFYGAGGAPPAQAGHAPPSGQAPSYDPATAFAQPAVQADPVQPPPSAWGQAPPSSQHQPPTVPAGAWAPGGGAPSSSFVPHAASPSQMPTAPVVAPTVMVPGNPGNPQFSAGAPTPSAAPAVATVPEPKAPEEVPVHNIVQTLNRGIEMMLSANLDARKKKLVSDASQRFDVLNGLFASGKVPGDAEAALSQYAQGLVTRDIPAMQDGMAKANKHYGVLGAKVMLGLKRLIQAAQ